MEHPVHRTPLQKLPVQGYGQFTMVDFNLGQIGTIDVVQRFDRIDASLFNLRQDLVQITLREGTKNCHCTLFGSLLQLLVLAGVILLLFLTLQEILGKEPKPEDQRTIIDPYTDDEESRDY